MPNGIQELSDILQIVPREPGSHDGVGDYALSLAHCLLRDHGLTTTVVVAKGSNLAEKEGFPILSGLLSIRRGNFSGIIVHYANYGYDRRGIPSELRDVLRGIISGRTLPCVVTFHEIYASGPPWRSAFWTRPAQVRIARDLIQLSTACVVSNEIIREEIHRADPSKRVFMLPVMSNFGEGETGATKTPRRWAICGGSALIERSLASFVRNAKFIPPDFFPVGMEVVGGTSTERIGNLLERVRSTFPEVEVRHHPAVDCETASAALASCSWGWLDYFGSGKVWPTMIFKSSSFAAMCAHGLIPIFSHVEDRLSVNGDDLPGPFFCTARNSRFPEAKDLSAVRQAFQDWYARNASCKRAAAVYAEALKT
jgi:hypothetical protein